MRLPNGDRAEVDLRKLSDYCLSPAHPVGKHKAAVFRSALGIGQSDAAILRQWLLDAAVCGEVEADRVDEFGERFRIDFEAATPVGRAAIRSVWIVRPDGEVPHLVTCFVLPR